ncbi:MAG: hypothetical protein ABIR70_17745 [Bryobacteraceae bacterium]
MSTDLLYEFSLAKELPDADLLEDFVRRYPEHAGALTDFAIDIVLDAAQGEKEGAEENIGSSTSPAVSRAMSQFQNRRFAVQRERGDTAAEQPADAGVTEQLFADLDRGQFRSLADRLHSNTVFVGMLRDREIDPATMSPGFQRFVADEMKAPLSLVAAHFAADAQIQRGQFYKSEDKPRAMTKLGFEEAVRTSGLTEEQQHFLLSL